MEKIATTIITGFLGAGKTSLIKNLLSKNRDKKIALIINEFGDLGIDKEVLSSCGLKNCLSDDIIELSNGCICCTLGDDFLPAMERILAMSPPPDHIIIETSGLALPQPLIKAFEWPSVKLNAAPPAVVVVLDCNALSNGRFVSDESAVEKQRKDDDSLDHLSPLEELFNSQLSAANVVILNKSDLIKPIELAIIKGNLKENIPSGVLLLEAKNADVPSEILFSNFPAQEKNKDEEHHEQDHDHDHDHDHDQFISFRVDLANISNSANLERALIEIIKQQDILRIKGFIFNPAKTHREVIQAVGTSINRYFDIPISQSDFKTSRLIIIGLRTMDKQQITRALSIDF